MYRVLVPIDTDEARARVQAEAVAALPNASEEVQADLLYVYEEIDAAPDEAGDFYIDEINKNLGEYQGMPDTIDLAVELLEGADVETAVHDVTGEPAAAILDIADEFDADSIVLGSRRRSPVGKVLFGSVTQAVILDSDRPVMVVPT